MCSDPQEFENGTGACRKCDECIAARRAGWVARGCAEKTQWQHALCVDLTYDDNAPGGADAAQFFAYFHIRGFIQRITAALRRIDKSLSVRFLCAGEQGDRNGRCHWHCVLYSDYDLRTLGKVTIRGNPLTDTAAMMTVGKRKRRLHWSLWAVDKIPLGFVTFREADEPNIAYSLSYALKDQFTVEKSLGSGREAKAENFATGLFRMSKRPAIGEAWLMQKLQHLDDLAAVVPNTNFAVPGLSGYWFPSGPLREKLLWGLRAINQRRIWSGSGVSPQWSGLLEACKDNPSDMEILCDPQEDDETDIGEDIGRKARWIAGERANAQAARRRGVRVLCYICLIDWTEAERQSRGIGSHVAQDDRWLRFYDAETGAYAISSADQIAADYGACGCENCGRSRYLRVFDRAPLPKRQA